MPPAPASASSLVLPLSSGQMTSWRTAVEDARKARKDVAQRWDWEGNLDRYAPKNVTEQNEEIHIGVDFADVERKKTALFYSRPDVTLSCDDPQAPLIEPAQVPPGPDGSPGKPPLMGTLVHAHQRLLNVLLGERHLDIEATVHRAILSALLVAGVGPVQVGYRAVTQTIEQPPMLDPITGAPPADPETGEPLPGQTVTVTIFDEYFVDDFSPFALLIPVEARTTDTRKWPWIGRDFVTTAARLRSDWNLPPDLELPAASEKPYARPDDQPAAVSDEDREVSGCYIEYRSLLYGQGFHPQQLHQLVLIDGLDQPVVHRPTAHQTFDAEGRLTPDSVPDFTILPLYLRDLTDSAWVQADCTVTGPLTREIEKFREQAIEQRNTARQIILYDASKLTPDAVDDIKDGRMNMFVPVQQGALDAGRDSIAQQITTAALGRESWLGQDYMMSDREKILGISSNQQGATTPTRRSATEVSTMQRNTDARFNHEQGRTLKWYVRIVHVLDTMVVRYGDARFATRLLGPRKGPYWAQFKTSLANGYVHDVNPDSAKYIDVEAQRRQYTQLYQMTRQDPLINPQPVTDKVLAVHGVDPESARVQPQPAKPTPPKTAFSFSGEDLNPLAPQFDLTIAIAKQGGYQIDDQLVTQAKEAAKLAQLSGLPATASGTGQGSAPPQTTHGGPAPQQHALSKKQMDETGDRTGPKT